MATLKENLIKEIQEINDERVLASLQGLIHSVKDASSYIHVSEEQKAAFEEAGNEYKKGSFHKTDDLSDDVTTLTIDIPDTKTDVVVSFLEKQGVKVRKSSSANLDKLEAEDYRKHFKKQADTGKGVIKDHL